MVNHVVFCTGIDSATPNMPVYPGMKDAFKGQILHSSQHKKALDHAGKKVVVVGACTSGRPSCIPLQHFTDNPSRTLILAHDIAVDYYDHGVGTFMFTLVQS